MTPSRRRSARPQRREDHRPVTPAGQAAGSVNNPIVLEGNPPPQVPAVDRNKGRTKDKEGRKPARDSKGRFIKSESSMKPGKGNNKVTKKTPAPKKEKARPEKLECVICATSKNTKRCFKASSWDGICDHFQSICDLCVSKMIKTKISERQLTDAHLPCAFPSCDIMLDHAALKHVLTKALFTTWDDALAKHLVAADPSNVACLNPKCGAYFSTEGCNGKEKLSSGKIKPKSKSSSKSSSKNKEVGVKVTCPYCEHDQCLSCTRPWHTGSCDSVKQREDKKSEQTIKKMGAKPCPQCGVNIQKQGGCDHMKCQNCRHNFCWECLGIFRGNNDDHAETCSHRRAMIAHDIGNFAHEDLTEAQINALIERARQERDQGRVPRPNLQLAPGVEIVHGVAVHTAPPRPLPGQGEPAQRVAMPPHDNAQFNAFFQQVRQLLGLPARAPQ